MRDILQSRYLRSNIAHKQLARTSEGSAKCVTRDLGVFAHASVLE